MKRRSRLLQLAAVAALLFVTARAVSWSRGGRDDSVANSGGSAGCGAAAGGGERAVVENRKPIASAAAAAAANAPQMPAVDLAACMAEDNATVGRPMTTDMYLSGNPTRCPARMAHPLLLGRLQAIRDDEDVGAAIEVRCFRGTTAMPFLSISGPN